MPVLKGWGRRAVLAAAVLIALAAAFRLAQRPPGAVRDPATAGPAGRAVTLLNVSYDPT